MKEDSREEIITIEETEFKLFHLKLKNTHNQMNKIVYCAHSREVIEEKIKFSGKTSFTDSDGSVFFLTN